MLAESSVVFFVFVGACCYTFQRNTCFYCSWFTIQTGSHVLTHEGRQKKNKETWKTRSISSRKQASKRGDQESDQVVQDEASPTMRVRVLANAFYVTLQCVIIQKKTWKTFFAGLMQRAIDVYELWITSDEFVTRNLFPFSRSIATPAPCKALKSRNQIEIVIK